MKSVISVADNSDVTFMISNLNAIGHSVDDKLILSISL